MFSYVPRGSTDISMLAIYIYICMLQGLIEEAYRKLLAEEEEGHGGREGGEQRVEGENKGPEDQANEGGEQVEERKSFPSTTKKSFPPLSRSCEMLVEEGD